MSHSVNSLSDLDITAYHEAGHTVVAHALGKRIGRYFPNEEWIIHSVLPSP